jgi:hypothetical protein
LFTLFDFFKTLNQNPTNDGDGATVLPEIDENLVNNLNIEINGHIKSEEILHCAKNLKNEKACGDDIIKNEYIKSSIDVFLPVYLKLFNCIFDSGIIPESWLTGNVKPIWQQACLECYFGGSLQNVHFVYVDRKFRLAVTEGHSFNI